MLLADGAQHMTEHVQYLVDFRKAEVLFSLLDLPDHRQGHAGLFRELLLR